MLHQRLNISRISFQNFFRRSAMLFIAMLGAVLVKSGFSYDSPITLLKAAALFCFLGGVSYTLILTTSVQLFIERIGFFNIFLNAGLLCLVAKILPAFQIDRFSTAFWAGFLINLISWGVSAISIFTAARKENSSSVKHARAKVIGTRPIPSSDDDKKA